MIQSYLNSRYFDCRFEMKSGRPIACQPLYSFNFMEQLGNALLTPADLAIKKFMETDSSLGKIGIAIVGLATPIIGCVGVGFKKLGELSNPHIEHKNRAYTKLNEILLKVREITGSVVNDEKEASFEISMMQMLNSSSDVVDLFELQLLFNQKILIEKQGATDADLNAIGARGLIGTLSASLSGEATPEEAEKRQSLQARLTHWVEAWVTLAQKCQQKQDITQEEENFHALTQTDDELHKAMMEHLKKRKTKMANETALNALCDEYNQIIRSMN